MENEILTAIISLISAVAVAVITGFFSSRAYLKKQISAAQSEADIRRKHSKERALAIRNVIATLCRAIFWITFVLEKDIAKNGELDKLKTAMSDLDAAERRLKELERSIAEE